MSGSRTVWSTISCSFMGLSFASASMNPFTALDLAAVHDAPRLGIERIASVQHGKIVPHQEVADLPSVAQGEAGLGRVRPQCIEQRLTLRHLHAKHIGVRTAAEEQRFAPCSRL